MRRPSLLTVTLALAVIAAVALVSPVFGLSKGLKKAIRKEVAKQLAGATGPQGPPGPAGTDGADGTPLAYAHITSTGALDGANSQKITFSSAPITGVTCLKVTAERTPTSVVASLETAAVGSPSDRIRATLDSNVVDFNCGPDANLLVETADKDGVGRLRPFNVSID